ncbi:MAG: DUF4258 domain-containing protein [Nitrospinae bacterium]|nr:DUF4258 domain-containing protein [Nitrospinota bacterium]
MKDIGQIRWQIQAGQFEFSRHAFLRAVERNISEQEIRFAGAMAEIIEEYPDDKYSPSALLLGFTEKGVEIDGPQHTVNFIIGGSGEEAVRHRHGGNV